MLWTQSTTSGVEVFNVHAKKTYTPQATQGVGIGAAWVAISQPKAVPKPTQAIHLCGPPYPCRSLTLGLNMVQPVQMDFWLGLTTHFSAFHPFGGQLSSFSTPIVKCVEMLIQYNYAGSR
jgi:hypothetical protein